VPPNISLQGTVTVTGLFVGYSPPTTPLKGILMVSRLTQKNVLSLSASGRKRRVALEFTGMFQKGY
jgi:hypothetical protein